MKFSPSAKDYDIVGIGVATLDILTIVKEFPSEETVQQAIEAKFQGGGPVATALVAAAKLGAKVAIIDSLGDDFVGQAILEEFKSHDVITKHVQITPGKTSSIASVWIKEADGKRAIAYRPGNAPELMGNALDLEIIKKAKILHLNGRHLQFSLNACSVAQEHGVKISFDGGGGRYRSELDSLIPLLDICIVARDFAQKYAKTTNLENAAECFLAQGCELVVITDGEHGSHIFPQQGENFWQPAFELDKVVDTTGCGDIYHGVFLFSLLAGLGLRESAQRATAAAAINAQCIGGRGILSTMPEILDFMVSSNQDP
ncbi:sugar kinase, ribokinase [Xenococcus sp. PCC 7305]|uniref:carbohydrate kinase family protein n=1 Tax=Xenococcus sp. PCC 7305 TaxID=102125 RepID=UPI0002AC84D4|nr:carbohydrate kinase family protein [Xenococcus sp. PCC 7305]ELS02334.1 sugar kinase, ribokinase [Xenococcus sp. PCC 7305]